MSAAVRSELVSGVTALLGEAQLLYAGTPAEARLRQAAARFDEPLRVAVAGKVKAGKSTLLNAIVGEELAPTDAGECTKIVTWYRNGQTYVVRARSRGGEAKQVPFRRDGGPIAVDLAAAGGAELESLEIEWPSAALRRMTLIDTPGIGSLSTDVSERTRAFLTPGEDEVTEADAVLYLMRHMHADDVRFLEAFHDEEMAQATPINAIGILSRADELGQARSDAMTTAGRIATRYRRDASVRRLCQTVVPVAGLLAQSAQELREDEFRALAAIAAAPRDDVVQLLLSVDRFTAETAASSLTAVEREHLLWRFGLYGVRVATTLISSGEATSGPDLARELLARSGLKELEHVLLSQFAARTDVLKSRSAMLAVESALRDFPVSGSGVLAAALERIKAGAHAFAELRVLNALRSGAVTLKDKDLPDAERLLGASGTTPRERVGLGPEAESAAIKDAATASLRRWRQRAESPMSSREVVEAAGVLVRTCEGILMSEGST